jgi:S-adenosylmethionine:tRNA ribosyltransferase-isomerase
VFGDVRSILEPGDLLLANNTRVSAIRLHGVSSGGGQVEALLLQPLGQNSYLTMTKPARKFRMGSRFEFGAQLTGFVTEVREEGFRVLKFEGNNVQQSLAQDGQVPLPPYIHAQLADPTRYQTVYAGPDGSAAAPTAGLHFTNELLASLKSKGVDCAYVTLDVSIDTFRPVQVDRLDDHVMHGETCEVSEATVSAVNGCAGRVIAVGTTSVRTLESFYDQGQLTSGRKVTKAFIRPGYEFKVVDGMFTNFHMPRTTMLVMLAAMVGREPLMWAYASAIENRYRFLSFGDSMLIL